MKSRETNNPQNRFRDVAVEYDDGEAAPPSNVTLIDDHARSILSENDSPDLPFKFSANPYRGCSHACAYCAAGDTPILMADSRTKRLADLVVGDEILGTLGGLALPSMGTSALHKNILLEIDWFDDSLDCGAHTHRPSAAAIANVTAAFANAPNANPDGSSGASLIVDYGQDAGQDGYFKGGNVVADADGVIAGGIDSPADADEHKGEEGKYDKYFSPDPGKGD